MCECNLLVDSHCKPVPISLRPHNLIYHGDSGPTVLLQDFHMIGEITFASVSAIANCHGVRRGYMFIIGEAAQLP